MVCRHTYKMCFKAGGAVLLPLFVSSKKKICILQKSKLAKTKNCSDTFRISSKFLLLCVHNRKDKEKMFAYQQKVNCHSTVTLMFCFRVPAKLVMLIDFIDLLLKTH